MWRNAGASDDGAGCAVVLETLRALSAARAPLRHDVVALLNGAEENIMQASHAFITQHKYAQPHVGEYTNKPVKHFSVSLRERRFVVAT